MSKNGKIKLTKRVVEVIEPSEKDIQVMDSELSGFGLRVKPSGMRSYFIRYRNSYGRQRKFTLGVHGKITVDQARTMAREHFAAIARGQDPSASRKDALHAPDMNELLDRYLSDHVQPKRRARTRKEYERLIDRHIRPRLGRLKVRAVVRNDIDRLHQNLKATHYQANRMLAVLSKLFSLAEVWGMRDGHTNPCHGIERFKEARRQRILGGEELRRLGEVLEQARREGWFHQRHVVDAIYFLALSYRRLSDVLNLTWEHVHIDDPEHMFINLPQTKTVEQDHVISYAAANFLRSLPRREGCPWVFPRNNLQEPLTANDVEKAWRNRIRKAAGLDASGDKRAARLHDLRHTGATYGAQTGANAYLLREFLGHATAAMTDRYVGREVTPLQKMNNEVGARIWASLAGESEGGEVVPLGRHGSGKT